MNQLKNDYLMPFSLDILDSSCAIFGSIVELSIKRAFFEIPFNIPSSANRVSFTMFPVGSIVITISESLAASAADLHGMTPLIPVRADGTVS